MAKKTPELIEAQRYVREIHPEVFDYLESIGFDADEFIVSPEMYSPTLSRPNRMSYRIEFGDVSHWLIRDGAHCYFLTRDGYTAD